MSDVTRSAWDEARFSLGIGADDAAYRSLVAKYAEPHRRYHGRSHLAACISLFDTYRALATRPGEVLAALLFHDAVYDPLRDDNETESGNFARACLSDAGPDATERIAAMITATRTHDAEKDGDTALVLDIDLAILGAERETFDAFERAIEEEYAFVPSALFARGRIAILTRFLSRPRIYLHEATRDAFESKAQGNLSRRIAQLNASI